MTASLRLLYHFVNISTVGKRSRALTYFPSCRDDSAAELAHAQARPFYCDQRVGDNPTTDWIVLPFRESFAFKAVPLVCGQATLTMAVEGMIQDDVSWKGNKLTVLGESGEVLGNLFEEDESLMNTQVGGPILDTIVVSAEKMIEFTGDGDFEFSIYSQQGMTGSLKIRYMKLGFRYESRLHKCLGVNVRILTNSTRKF